MTESLSQLETSSSRQIKWFGQLFMLKLSQCGQQNYGLALTEGDACNASCTFAQNKGPQWAGAFQMWKPL